MRHRNDYQETSSTRQIDFYFPFDMSVRKAPHIEDKLTYSKNRDMWDIVTPQFEKSKNRGLVINNPMTQTSYQYNSTLNSFENYLGVYTRSDGTIDEKSGFYDSGTMFADSLLASATVPGVPTDFGESLPDIAVSQAWENVSQAQATMLVSLAEANKTVSSMQSIFSRLIRILKNVKKLRIKELLGELSPNELSDRWLEARYAIRPLIYDLESIVKAHNYEIKHNRYTARGFSKDTYTDTHSGSVQNYASFTTHYHSSVQHSRECRAGVLYEVELQGIENSLAVWGFTSPIEAVWELVPFSFIIDWFFNVGSVIASWAPKKGLVAKASWVKVTDTTIKTCSITNLTVTPNQFLKQDERVRYVTGSGSWTSVTVNVSRIPRPDRPVLPSFNLNLDLFKLVDLILIARKLAS